MMKSYILFLVCVVLCTVQSVHSYIIRGAILHKNGAVSEVIVSHYVSGENWINTKVFTLTRLEGAETLPQLTLVNFQYIETFKLRNIALENVPVFVNTSCSFMYITGNKIKSVPTNVFSGPVPQFIDLSNNEIQSMADRSVNTRAEHLILVCNKLTHFSQSWFADPSNIVKLDLSGNRIGHIQDRAFSQMTKLDALYLNYNHITSIGSEVFPAEISYLFLAFNSIIRLTTDMFTHRDERIVELYLHHNQLTYLPEALLLKMKPKDITLFGNPWHCQCLRDIERWLRELNTTRYDFPARRGEPVCVVPASFPNVCVPAVDTELQQIYARGLSPVQGCLASRCIPCNEKNFNLVKLT